MRLRSKEENRVRQIPLVQICPGKAQPRKNFSNEELLELARSIQENGVLQPLTVRKAGLAGFELIAGERRLRAAALAGSEKVPCLPPSGWEKSNRPLPISCGCSGWPRRKEKPFKERG